MNTDTRTPRETETRSRAEHAKTMTCAIHRDGKVVYRPVYSSYECNHYIERVLFSHVVGHA